MMETIETKCQQCGKTVTIEANGVYFGILCSECIKGTKFIKTRNDFLCKETKK